MTEQYIRERITSLRTQKKVSEYKMSQDLGHCKSYVQAISSGRALPSMSEFLGICEYLGVTPCEFFDEATDRPDLVSELNEEARRMEPQNLELLVSIGKKLS